MTESQHQQTTTGGKKLTVTAKSSDEVEPPTLTVKGFGDINPETGTLEIPNVTYISPTITITSTNKGTVTIPVNINRIPVQPIPVEAIAGVDKSVTVGAPGNLRWFNSKVPLKLTYGTRFWPGKCSTSV